MAIDMWNYINSILVNFRTCFNRKATFGSFVIIVVGFMLNTGSAGITSIIRTLGLEPGGYEALVHFFVPTRGGLQPSECVGHRLSKIPELCSQKMGCLFLSEMG
jgi:hypothetical protein